MTGKIDIKAVQQFGHLEFLARQVVEGFITGLHKSPFHGFSVEFAEHRQYNPGESTKHIDWKLYARTEKFFIKKYEEETNLRCRLIVDHSSSMYYPDKSAHPGAMMNKIEFSVYCAASIAYMMRKQRDAVGLSVFSDEIETHLPCKSTSAHHKYLLTELEKLLKKSEKTRKTFAVNALHSIAENIHKRSLVIVFSDMMDNSGVGQSDIFSALQHLKHNKHEVILFHVLDANTERKFEFDNRPYTFVDTETGEEIKLHALEMRSEYLRAMEQFEKGLKLRCGQYGIDFYMADINKGFDNVLLQYLIKRSALY